MNEGTQRDVLTNTMFSFQYSAIVIPFRACMNECVSGMDEINIIISLYSFSINLGLFTQVLGVPSVCLS